MHPKPTPALTGSAAAPGGESSITKQASYTPPTRSPETCNLDVVKQKQIYAQAAWELVQNERVQHERKQKKLHCIFWTKNATNPFPGLLYPAFFRPELLGGWLGPGKMTAVLRKG